MTVNLCCMESTVCEWTQRHILSYTYRFVCVSYVMSLLPVLASASTMRTQGKEPWGDVIRQQLIARPSLAGSCDSSSGQ